MARALATAVGGYSFDSLTACRFNSSGNTARLPIERHSSSRSRKLCNGAGVVVGCMDLTRVEREIYFSNDFISG